MRLASAIFGIVGLLLVSTSGSISAETKYRICQGQHSDSSGKCSGYDIHVPCPQNGGNVEARAVQACSVRTSEGVVPGKYRLIQLTSVSGNRCGYTMYQLTCLD